MRLTFSLNDPARLSRNLSRSQSKPADRPDRASCSCPDSSTARFTADRQLAAWRNAIYTGVMHSGQHMHQIDLPLVKDRDLSMLDAFPSPLSSFSLPPSDQTWKYRHENTLILPQRTADLGELCNHGETIPQPGIRASVFNFHASFAE